MYAVIRDGLIEKKFSVWHESLGEAKTEAERLCRKENCNFIILKAVLVGKINYVPVTFEEIGA